MCKDIKKGVFDIFILFLIIIFMFNIVYATTICSCKPLTYQFGLKNIENFSETYKLGIDKFSDYISFNQDKVVLNSGENSSIYVFINLPCNVTGKHIINIIIKGEKTKRINKIPLNLNIPCYDYTIKLGEGFLITGEKRKVTFKGYEGNYSICNGDKSAIPILITNKGIDNEYSFDLKGPDWAKLSGNKIKLVKNQNGLVYLSLSPPEELEGKFKFDFNVINKLGNIKKIIPINVNVEKCYGIDIELPTNEDILCGCEPKNYELIINNTGKYNNSFDFITEPYWVNLDLEGSISLNGTDSVSINVNVEPPCKILKTTEVKVTGFLRNHPTLKDSDSLKLNFLSKEKCYKAIIIADQYIKIDYDTTFIPFNIKNQGEKETTYSISLDAPDWVSSEIEILTIKPKDTANLKLDAKLDKTIIEGNYVVKINLRSEDYRQSKVIVLKLKERVLFKKVKGFIKNYLYYLITGIISLVIIFFVIFKFKKKKKLKLKKKLTFPVILTLMSLIAVGAIIYLLYHFSLLNKIEWYLFWYRYYIYTLILLVIIIIIFFRKRKKKKKVKTKAKTEIKTEAKEEAKKEIKTKRKAKIFGWISILIIIFGLLYLFIKFNLFIKEFIVAYLYYIILGVALLIILILIIRFNKKIRELFLGEEKKKK